MSANIITPKSQPVTTLIAITSPAIRSLLRFAKGSSDPGTARMLHCLAAQLSRLQQGRKDNANNI
jgi:hypothetical protein